MTNHCLSLAEKGWKVTLMGHKNSNPPTKVMAHENIQITIITPWKIQGAPFIIYALVKILSETFQTLWKLLTLPRFEFILVQNPPAIPSLLICFFISFFRRCYFIIDWHNFG